jgi:hypothetical protein
VKIAETTRPFLDEASQTLSPKTVKKYEYVLELFLDYLGSYAELTHGELGDGSIVLTAETTELHDGQVETFLEWFLIRKVIGPAWLTTSAPGILKKYVKWLDERDLLAEGAIDDLTEVTKKASKDLPRVEKAAELLYRLCQKNSHKLRIDALDDDEYSEGYGDVTRIVEDKLYLNHEGDKVGPVQITGEIARYLKKGDTINIVVGRKGKVWYPLEVGNVYPGR